MVQKAGFFSVIADEATDIANDEQLSILLTVIHHIKSSLLFIYVNLELLVKQLLMTFFPSLLNGNCNLIFFVMKRMMEQE